MKVNNHNIEQIKEEIKKSEEKKREKAARAEKVVIPKFETLMTDRLDFIIKKHLKASSSTLVFLFSRKLFYFYQEPSGTVSTNVDSNHLSSFFSGYSDNLILLNENIFNHSKKTGVMCLSTLIELAKKSQVETTEQVETAENEMNFSWPDPDKLDYQIIQEGLFPISSYTLKCNHGSYKDLRALYKKSKKAARLVLDTEDSKFPNWQAANSLYDIFGFNIFADILETYAIRRKLFATFNFDNILKLKKAGLIDAMRFWKYLKTDLLSRQQSTLYTWADTINLQQSLYGKVKEKYPRNVEVMHQLLVRESNERQMAHDYDEAFKRRMSSLDVNYTYRREKYMVVVPENAVELVEEGRELCHCVAEYISKVANGDCVVLFIRERRNPKKSFYTMEIEGGKITQVEGYQRSITVTPEINQFIEDFAKAKELKNTVFLNIRER